jgi:hypothetical protein
VLADAVVGEADTITVRGSLLLPLVVRHTLTLPPFSFTVYVDEPKLIVTVNINKNSVLQGRNEPSMHYGKE